MYWLNRQDIEDNHLEHVFEHNREALRAYAENGGSLAYFEDAFCGVYEAYSDVAAIAKWARDFNEDFVLNWRDIPDVIKSNIDWMGVARQYQTDSVYALEVSPDEYAVFLPM